MKHFIVSIAIIPLLMTLIMQCTHSQVINQQKMEIERALSIAETSIAIEGYLTASAKSDLETAISEAVGIEADNVEVTCTATSSNKVYRANSGVNGTGKIEYTVEFIFPNIMAGNEFYGIKDEDNCVDVTISRTVYSEKLAA